MKILDKKLLTLLGLLIFAISIPLTVFLVKQRQEIKSKAQEAGINSIDNEFIGIASNNWHFETKTTHTPFTPFGVSYTPSWAGWAPGVLRDQYWATPSTTEAKIEQDLSRMEELGVNYLRVMFSYDDVIKDSPAFGRTTVKTVALDRIQTILEQARNHHIKVTLAGEITWWRQIPPSWWLEGNVWFGEGNEFQPASNSSALVIADFWRQLAERFKNDPVLFGYGFQLDTRNQYVWEGYRYYNPYQDPDPNCLPGWKCDGRPINAWRAYLKQKFVTIQSFNEYFNRTYLSFQEIPIPEKGYRLNDPFLYEFFLFKEYYFFKLFYPAAQAIREQDPNHLIGLEMGTGSPLIARQTIGGVNAKEMLKIVDFVAPHSYNPNSTVGLRTLLRGNYFGKPVLLGEYGYTTTAKCQNSPSANPGDANINKNAKVVWDTIQDVSGWVSWAFEYNPSIIKDDGTNQCTLIDQNGNLTNWGQVFQQLAPQIKNQTLQRESPKRTHIINKKLEYTKDYHDPGSTWRTIIGKWSTDPSYGPVDFQITEDNCMIERFLGHESTCGGPLSSPTPTPTRGATPTTTPTRTPTPTPTRGVTPTPTTPPPSPGAEYGDNVLDIRDYNTFVSCFRKKVTEVPGCEAADLNDDGTVDSSDFVLLFESFQTQYGD